MYNNKIKPYSVLMQRGGGKGKLMYQKQFNDNLIYEKPIYTAPIENKRELSLAELQALAHQKTGMGYIDGRYVRQHNGIMNDVSNLTANQTKELQNYMNSRDNLEYLYQLLPNVGVMYGNSAAEIPNNSKLKYQYQQGGEMGMQQQMPAEQGMAPQQEMAPQGGEDPMQQIVQMIAQALQQGTSPEEIIQMLVEQGVSQEEASQMVQMVMQQMQGGGAEQQQGMPMQRMGGNTYQMGGMRKSPLDAMKNYISAEQYNYLKKFM